MPPPPPAPRRARGRAGLGIEEAPERALAREPDQHRSPDRDEHVQTPDELEILRRRLAEADPGIEADTLLGDAGRDREPKPLLEEGGHLGSNVLVARVDLHGAWLALHVHQAEIGAALRHDLGQIGVAPQRGDVVDELDAELERAPGDLALRRVDRERHAVEPLEHGNDPAELLLD